MKMFAQQKQQNDLLLFLGFIYQMRKKENDKRDYKNKRKYNLFENVLERHAVTVVVVCVCLSVFMLVLCFRVNVVGS